MPFWQTVETDIGGALQNAEKGAASAIEKTIANAAGNIVTEVANQPQVKAAVNTLSQQASTPLANKITPYIALGAAIVIAFGFVIVKEARRGYR